MRSQAQILAQRQDHARVTRYKSRRFTRSNTGIAYRIVKDSRQHKRTRAAQHAAHLRRLDRDPKYRARCEKRRRDYVRCRVNSCHGVPWPL